MSSRIIVLRLSPVRRSVLRIEQPSRRQCSARAARICTGTHRAKRRLGLRFAEGNVAGLAAPALNAVLTEVPKSLAGLVLASGAGHVVSPLAFCEETSQNRFSRSMAWVTPRCGLVPASAETEAGTLSVSYVLGWWLDRDFHGLTVSEANCDCDRHADFILPESPVAAGLSHLVTKSSLPSQLVSTKFLGMRLW